MAAISKQDLAAPRTATDIERKYNFGKSFAEVMGIAIDARDTATEAKKTAETIDKKLTPDEIFNLLTNNGEVQGIFRDDDGQIYINASYLSAGVIKSLDGKSVVIDLENGNADLTGTITTQTNVDPETSTEYVSKVSPTEIVVRKDYAQSANVKNLLNSVTINGDLISVYGSDYQEAKVARNYISVRDIVNGASVLMATNENGGYITGLAAPTSGTMAANKEYVDGKLYPVGSVYVSTTNTNPSSKFGGTWTLIDKEFSELVASDSSGKYFVPVSSGASSYTLYIIRSGKTIDFRLNFYNAMALTDTAVTVGLFNFNALGIESLYYGAVYEPGGTDGGDAIPLFNVNWESGAVSVEDVLCKGSTTSIATGNSVYYRGRLQCNSDRMLDSACDKFYWKRTA